MTSEAVPDEQSTGTASRRRWTGFRLLALQIAVGVLLFVVLRAFVAQSFYVSSGSMEPAVAAGDRVVVFKPGDVERGDLIVFDGTSTLAAASREPYVSEGLIGRTLGEVADILDLDLGEQDFLKRVVAVGGDSVSCTPDGGLVVNGVDVPEPYLAPGVAACETAFDVEVPPGRLFVMGDNRPDSNDSRNHLGGPGGGTVPLEDVVGTVALRYWPLGELGRPE